MTSPAPTTKPATSEQPRGQAGPGRSWWPLYPQPMQGHELGLKAEVVRSGPETATPVVFLHGLVGLNEHWDDLVEKIKHSVGCMMLEMPLLSMPNHDCSIEGVTGVIERFLREQVGRPAVLVGNSFGGHVALRIAIQRPEMVKGLVLAGSSGLVEKSMVSTIEIRPTRSWLEKKIGELYFDPANVRPQDVDRAFKTLTQRGAARAMVKLSRSARKDVLRQQVGRITAPTLIVWGRQDVVTPPEAAEAFHQLIPGSRLVWIDNCGHVPMAEGTDVFAREMLTFVEGLRA